MLFIGVNVYQPPMPRQGPALCNCDVYNGHLIDSPFTAASFTSSPFNVASFNVASFTVASFSASPFTASPSSLLKNKHTFLISHNNIRQSIMIHILNPHLQSDS
jgi:hypothetical protein